MDKQRSFEIAFETKDRAEALRLANELEQDLVTSGSIQVSRKKDRVDSQDFGSTLVLLFGTPVAIGLAKAVSTFLQRNSGASIRISEAGEIIAINLDSRDASRIAEAFARKSR
jgi:hypothetical protein